MPIIFDPRQSGQFRPTPCVGLKNSRSSGFSGIPSSIQSRLDVNASEGICSWITQLFAQICSLFGWSSLPISEGTSTTVNPLDKKIADGNEIIDRHFRSDFIVNADAQHSGIVVVMKYHGRTVVSFGRTDTQRNEIASLKTKLRQLLSDVSQPTSDRDTMSIETMLFKKSNNTFDYIHVNSYIVYEDGDQSGGGTGQADRVSLVQVSTVLGTTISSLEERRNILRFLNQL
jgi:hypothetical protein